MADDNSAELPPEKKKRVRGKNFSHLELECIVSEVEKHLDLINSKFTDTVTNNKKQKVWVSIAKAVSAVSLVDRGSEEVRIRFTKLKSEVKKKAGMEIRERNKTGGGPEMKFNYTPFEEKVLQMIGKKHIYIFCTVSIYCFIFL